MVMTLESDSDSESSLLHISRGEPMPSLTTELEPPLGDVTLGAIHGDPWNGHQSPGWSISPGESARNLPSAHSQTFLLVLGPISTAPMAFPKWRQPRVTGGLPELHLRNREQIETEKLHSLLKQHRHALQSGTGSVELIRRAIATQLAALGEVYVGLSELARGDAAAHASYAERVSRWKARRDALVAKVAEIRSPRSGEGARLAALERADAACEDEISALRLQLERLVAKKSVLKREISESRSVVESRCCKYLEQITAMGLPLENSPTLTQVPEGNSTLSLNKGNLSLGEALRGFWSERVSLLEEEVEAKIAVAVETVGAEAAALEDKAARVATLQERADRGVTLWALTVDHIEFMEAQVSRVAGDGRTLAAERALAAALNDCYGQVTARLPLAAGTDAERAIVNECEALREGLRLVLESSADGC